MRWIDKIKNDPDKIIFLSHGGGVDSTALYLLLMDNGLEPMKDFWPIYVDTGGDLPESRAYVRQFARTYPLLIVTPNVEGYTNIFDYFWHKQIIPFFSGKSCNAKWKMAPLERMIRNIAADLDPWGDKGFYQCLGYNADEGYREARSADRFQDQGVKSIYPLIEEGLGREACKQLIRDHGLTVPPKSACFFCGAQKAHEWKSLRRNHPELYESARLLEERSNNRRKCEGKAPAYFNALCPVNITADEDLATIDNEKFPAPKFTLAPLKASDQEYVNYLVEKEMDRRYGPYFAIVSPGSFEEAFNRTCTEMGVPFIPLKTRNSPRFSDEAFDFDLAAQPRTYTLSASMHRTIRKHRNRALNKCDAMANLILELDERPCPGGPVGSPPDLPGLCFTRKKGKKKPAQQQEQLALFAA
ncbi:hypothetical protein [Desulfovibrio ferrophilus]|uniref:Phosphoadenosine phosphosulphate reductase domain-containing protein n=1 Tax=Desulfovibrio ferrophilus TaxID=241368 RepID=A0A2Z6B3N5_9BACT|nr:hypothetical protein [Desulfovibrio ferrophilus]BBD10112.1 uncharacterized protein DFE_A0011 [Desulfovibrio ferrophilus]